MADTTKSTAAAVDKPTGTLAVLIERDYWPKSDPPADWPADEEYRLRAGVVAQLPTDEAVDAIEAGIAKRARG